MFNAKMLQCSDNTPQMGLTLEGQVGNKILQDVGCNRRGQTTGPAIHEYQYQPVANNKTTLLVILIILPAWIHFKMPGSHSEGVENTSLVLQTGLKAPSSTGNL